MFTLTEQEAVNIRRKLKVDNLDSCYLPDGRFVTLKDCKEILESICKKLDKGG